MLNKVIENDSITSIIRKNAVQDKVALIHGDEELTYSDLLGLVDTYAGKLSYLGVQKNTKVMTLLPNGLAMTAIMLAIAEIGAILIPLNPEYKSDQIQQAVRASYAEFILHEQELLLECSTNKVDIRHFEQVPYQAYICAGTAASMYILTMTSGSTGEPKPVCFSQQTKINRAFAAKEIYGLDNKDIILCGTPQYHSLAQRLTLLPLLIGGTCLLLKQFSSRSWINEIKLNNVTFTIAVSSQLVNVLSLLEKEKPKLNSLKRIVSSSASIEKDIKGRLIKLLSCPIHECYGASEVGTVTDFDASNEIHKVASVGKVVSQAEVIIRDDDSYPVKSNEVGEITVKSSTAFLGYYEKPGLTKKAVKDDFFYTGDLGYIDDDGYLYFKGRKKEIIISGGINIYPEDIESVVNSFEDVVESAAFPIPSSHFGEVTAVAFVAKTKVTVREIRKWCSNNLATHQVPVFFIQVEELPKTALGKIQRNQCQSIFGSKFAEKFSFFI
ncbi:acyl--CoA ligase [Pseudoalteromonas sp. NZS71_1]|uniref:class I adenylate-forming enzyme family protein n=1 Tax=Pseudoalteromonas sp. NZS71_1 TaxID=2792072 RepID=UPI0018CEA326|nr:class I adenylate-forming enzyme family protein [Pseudoalteromonas sp. NZS71_1]MBH0033754.1 acyl--CoA ligase [Pseudoalteromonas sp. NZS71_1]